MTLISLLLVLGLERIATKTAAWHKDTYLERYTQLLRENELLVKDNNPLFAIGMIIIPAALCALVFSLLGGGLIQFVVSILILWMAIGCPYLRDQYKGYLQASNRGDFAARDLYAEQLGFDEKEGFSFGQHMVWINFINYYAVAIWFVIGGAPGVLLYVVARHALQITEGENKQLVEKVLFVLNWIPVRIASFGLLMIGHFTKGLSVWLSGTLDPTANNKALLLNVAKASEDVEPDTHDCTEEPCTLLRLSKRNMVLLLAVMAALTLGGWLS